MKRLIASALLVGVSTFGLVGCEEKKEAETVSKIKTPEGEQKITNKTTVESTGDQKGTTPVVEPPK